MSKVRIKLMRSPIDKAKRQKLTLVALGFRKVHQVVEHDNIPQIQGMLRVVEHLVHIENV